MHSLVQELQNLVDSKREAINLLHSQMHLQLEYEYDIAIHKLEFRAELGSEMSFEDFENILGILYDLLKEIDSMIAETLIQIEQLTFSISNV